MAENIKKDVDLFGLLGTLEAGGGGGFNFLNAAEVVSGRPTLIILGAPWCRNCKAMERSTLKEAAVRKELANFNVRRIEINDFGELARHPELAGLDIKGVPAYVILNEIPKETRK